MNETIKKIRLLSKEVIKDTLKREYGAEDFIHDNHINYATRCAAFHVFADNEYNISTVAAEIKTKEDVLNTKGMILELGIIRSLINDGTWGKEFERTWSTKLGFHHENSYERYKGLLEKHEILDTTNYKAKGFRTSKDSVFVNIDEIKSEDYEKMMNKIFDEGGYWDKEVSFYVREK